MTLTELKELRDQVRGLTGADREVDFKLQQLWHPIAAGMTFKEASDAPAWDIPACTGSMDAALSLSEEVLPGAVRRVYDDPENDCSGCDLITLDGRSVRGSGAKWEHAIIVATLTALIETMEAQIGNSV